MGIDVVEGDEGGAGRSEHTATQRAQLKGKKERMEYRSGGGPRSEGALERKPEDSVAVNVK